MWIDFSRPGKATDNAYIETFNGTLRAECLDTRWFGTLTEAKETIEAWRRGYNESRPHRALGERTPNEFACEVAANRDLTGPKAGESPLWGWYKNPGPLSDVNSLTRGGRKSRPPQVGARSRLREKLRFNRPCQFLESGYRHEEDTAVAQHTLR